MVSSAGGPDIPGTLDFNGSKKVNELAGAEDCLPSTKSISVIIERQGCVSVYRQHVSKSLHQPPGGTLLRPLQALFRQLFLWAEISFASLWAEHIPGGNNVPADCFSRQDLDKSKWHLHQDTFNLISRRFENMDCNLFASLNRQLQDYSQGEDGGTQTG